MTTFHDHFIAITTHDFHFPGLRISAEAQFKSIISSLCFTVMCQRGVSQFKGLIPWTDHSYVLGGTNKIRIYSDTVLIQV